MNAVLLLMLLGPPDKPGADAPPTAAMVIGVPPAEADRAAALPALVEHADGGHSIVFPQGYLMRTTLRRGFNGVWFTDCGPAPIERRAAR